MIARTERGLLLTTLWYMRTVDPTWPLLTGLTRDAVCRIEDGEGRLPSTSSGSTRAR
jgi:predicted Zn-dependent protease